VVQSWLWGTIFTELVWEKIDYHSFNRLPGIKYHTLKDKDDPSIAFHIDIPTNLDHYNFFCYHLDKHGINLESGQVLRLTSPPKPISERLREIYPQRYQGPRNTPS
jgi:hypothetical protein